MNLLLIVVGTVSLLWPIIALSGNTKELSRPLKLSPILVALFGGLMLWHHLATIVPVIPSATVNILSVSHGRMVIDLQVDEARSCKMEDLSVYFLDQYGGKHPGIVSLVDYGAAYKIRPVGPTTFGKSIIVTVDGSFASQMYFKSEHLCPFDIQVVSRFGLTPVPEKFNQ